MEEKLHPKRWLILWVVNMGTFISTLDVGIVNVALPTMAEEFGVNLSVMQWVVTCYLLTLVALLPILGKLSDKWGRNKIYTLGFFVFTFGSLLIALSTSFASLIVFRCAQGLGAAMIMANSQAMVRQVFPDRERGKALGINAIIISLGTLSGPAVGGWILGMASWPVLFWINVPLGLAAVIMGMKWFPRMETTAPGKLDAAGSVMLALAASTLLYAAVSIQEHGMASLSAGMGLFGLVALVCFLIYERRIDDGIIDMELFANRTIWVGNASSFFIHLAQMASLIPGTFYLQSVLKMDPGAVGIFLALQPIAMGLSAPLAGWYRDRYSAKMPVMLGAALCSISALFIVFAGAIHPAAIALHLIFFGAGMGLFQATNNADIMSAAPSAKLSLASSMLALIRYLGMIAGIGLAALFVGYLGPDTVHSAALDMRMKWLFGVCAVFCAAIVYLASIRFQRQNVQSNSDLSA
mgnify:CR=1 FL=1